MKVLVTNNTLGGLGGSETYAYALIKELHSRKDITVHAFSPSLGQVANRLKVAGVNVMQHVSQQYDLVLSSHNSTTPHILRNKGMKIQTCHGVFPKLEQPAKGLDKYVSITEEVQNHLTRQKLKSDVIFNGVDCKRFKPHAALPDKLKTILSLSHSEQLNKMLASVCTERGIKLIALNKYKNPVWDVENVINSAQLIVTLGRGAYESMACGRNVLVLDKRPYINKPPLGDGIIDETNINNFMKNNCSGRFSNKVFTVEDIKTELDKYNPKLGEFGREFALENLNIINQADKYLNLL